MGGAQNVPKEKKLDRLRTSFSLLSMCPAYDTPPASCLDCWNRNLASADARLGLTPCAGSMFNRWRPAATT